jgi:AcrR family transcriptional regulator
MGVIRRHGDAVHAEPARQLNPTDSPRRSANASRRGTARQRLLGGVTDAAYRHGFAGLTVEKVLAHTGVSRASFYQYFLNVEDCLWSAHRDLADQLAGEVDCALENDEAPELAALDAIASFASRRPAEALVLMREALAAGPAGVIERERLMARIVRTIVGSSSRPATVDLPLALLIGGAFRFLVLRLSDGNRGEGLRGELRAWVGAFAPGASGTQWGRRLAPSLLEPRSQAALSSFQAQGSGRERILRATALAIRAKGYPAVSVADIVAAAGVSRRRFYNEFPAKADAVKAAYELAFRGQLAETAPAFFSRREWRERVWHGARAFTGWMSREPLLAYLGLVECYAVGPSFTPRVHDTQLAFTLFLEDGYRQRPQAESLPRACSMLTATTTFELAFQASRRGPRFDVRQVQPLAVYVCLAPFIGPDEAGEFVTRKLSAGREDESAPV